ncbi:MAG: TIR domain-containing protein, partial [Magnetococcales bacterium]|nr:TIR domain-containing protein [Magnetococcales bacterium]
MKYNSKAFVSYSHDDSEDVSHFIKHIRPLERQGLVNVWHDKKIEPGDKWKEEIAKALDEANTAVLFISQSFLASDFIYEHELPLLLNAYLNGNLKIIPVFLSPSIVKSTEIIFTHPRTKEKKSINLAEIQGIGTPEKTLAHRTQTEQEELFVELAESIGASVSQHPSSGSVSYAEWALEKFGKLSMMGVEGGDIHLDMEKVFVPLRISQRNLDIDLEANRRQPVAWQARENSMGDVDLDKIFITPDGTLRQCVVLFGEPGAGKTTSLKKILHLCLNQGSSAFGLPRGIIPVFLRLRHFKDEFLHQPLEKFINKELNELSGERFPKELNRHLWSEGKLLLLFDGLDEIADSALRKKVARRIAECMFAVRHKEIHAVVSCRYSGYDKGVDLKHFFPLDVRPLDQGQVESFVTLWFDEACKHYGDAEKNAIKVRSQRLLGSRETSESSGERIQLLMGNPLLLTLLCVVVLRVGEIPKRRAAFYQRCLEILLTRWRKDQAGVEPLLDVNAALNILSPLAWQLHTEKRKDDVKWLEFANFADSHLNTKEDAPSGLRVLEGSIPRLSTLLIGPSRVCS